VQYLTTITVSKFASTQELLATARSYLGGTRKEKHCRLWNYSDPSQPRPIQIDRCALLAGLVCLPCDCVGTEMIIRVCCTNDRRICERPPPPPPPPSPHTSCSTLASDTVVRALDPPLEDGTSLLLEVRCPIDAPPLCALTRLFAAAVTRRGRDKHTVRCAIRT
jgi:hypothetical protein